MPISVERGHMRLADSICTCLLPNALAFYSRKDVLQSCCVVKLFKTQMHRGLGSALWCPGGPTRQINALGSQLQYSPPVSVAISHLTCKTL